MKCIKIWWKQMSVDFGTYEEMSSCVLGFLLFAFFIHIQIL